MAISFTKYQIIFIKSCFLIKETNITHIFFTQDFVYRNYEFSFNVNKILHFHHILNFYQNIHFENREIPLLYSRKGHLVDVYFLNAYEYRVKYLFTLEKSFLINYEEDFKLGGKIIKKSILISCLHLNLLEVKYIYKSLIIFKIMVYDLENEITVRTFKIMIKLRDISFQTLKKFFIMNLEENLYFLVQTQDLTTFLIEEVRNFFFFIKHMYFY